MSKYIVLSKQSCNISSFFDFLKSTIKSNHKKHFEANQLSNYRMPWRCRYLYEGISRNTMDNDVRVSLEVRLRIEKIDKLEIF